MPPVAVIADSLVGALGRTADRSLIGRYGLTVWGGSHVRVACDDIRDHSAQDLGAAQS